MADPIQILIKAILEKTSKQQLEAELRNIEQKLKPIDVKVQVDKIKEYEEASGKVKKIVTDTTDQLGRQISTTEKLIGATGTWEKTGRVVTSNYKQQRIEMDKIHIEALKLNDTYHRQHINQQKMLTTIRGIREKDAPFISSQNLKSLNELENAIIRLDPKSAQYTQRMREHELQLKKITTETGIYRQKIHEAGKYTNIFGQNLLEAGKKFAGWMLMGSIIMGIIRQLRFAITTLKEIDTELVNIAKITDYTKQEMQDLVKTAIAAGQELGRTAQEYLKAVTTFARAGFGKQAEEYAKLSLLLQNVGDVTAEVANETLIATNAGFQLQGSYQALMGIIDKFNNISNKNATTVEKMSEAMKVGASVFHSAGMSIDETVAIVGTATASTQRAGTEISRAWRTILMNIRQVKDEEAEVTEESMAKAEKALSSIGIIVRDSPQTFRPMFEILRDLGTRWEKLTEVEKAYVAESLAGKRQANVLISTLQNWDMVEKQLIESIEAEGSALRENEIYMQSWEARVKQLTASITSFWSNLINTDAIKSSISLLNSLVKIFDVLINNQFSQAIIKIGLYTGAFLLLNKILIMFRSSQLLALVAMISFDIATKGLTATIYGLAAAVYANPLFWPVAIIAGIYGLVKIIDALTTSLEDQRKIVQELAEEVRSLTSEYDQLKAKEDRTPAEERRLRLLDDEIKKQEALLKIETQRLIQQELFTPLSFKSGLLEGLELPQTAGIARVYAQIESLKALREELEKAESIEAARKLEQQILELEISLGDSQKIFLQWIDTVGEDAPQALLDLIDDIEGLLGYMDNALDEAEKSSWDYAQSLDYAFSTFKSHTDQVEALYSAYNKLSAGQQLSVNEIMKLVEQNQNLIHALEIKNGVLTLNIDKIKEEIDIQQKQTREALEQEKIQLEAKKLSLETELNGILRAINANLSLSKVRVEGIKIIYAEVQALQARNIAEAKSDPTKFVQAFRNVAGLAKQTIQTIGMLSELDKIIESIAGIDGLISALDGLGASFESVGKSAKDAYNEWLRNANSVADQVIRLIKDAYAKQKKIALATIDAERKANEEAYKARVKQLDDEYKKIADIIDLRIKEIDEQAEEEDFQKELMKLMQERGELEAEINKLALDDSFEARAKREELEKELAKKIDEIETLQTKRTRDLRKRELQDTKDKYRKEVDAKKAAEEEKYNAEKERLEKIRQETEYFWNEQINNERYFAQIREDILNGNIKNIKKTLGEFMDYFKSINKETAYELGVSFQELLNIIDRANQAIRDMQGVGKAPPSGGGGAGGSAPSPTPTPPSYTYNTASSAFNKGYSDGYGLRAKSYSGVNPAYYSNYDTGHQAGLNAKRFEGRYGHEGGIAGRDFHEGGIVGKGKDQYHNNYSRIPGGSQNRVAKLVDDLFNKRDDEVVAKLLDGENVINSIQSLPTFRANMTDFIKQISVKPGGESSTSNVINLNVHIDKLNGTPQDADKFVNMVFSRVNSGLQRMGKR